MGFSLIYRDDQASKKFKEVNEAYQTLSDANARQEYDFQRSGFGRPGRSFDPFAGFGDIFGDIFGRPQQRPRPRQDPNVTFAVPVKDLRTGIPMSMSFKVDTDVLCTDCNGQGGEDKVTCGDCNGAGRVTNTFQQGSMRFQGVTSCAKCHGTGTIIKNVCRSCLGNGFTRQKEIFDVTLTSRIRKG